MIASVPVGVEYYNNTTMRRRIFITENFDATRVIGYMEIEEEYLEQFPDITLAPAIILGKKNVLTELSVVPTNSYIVSYGEFKKDVEQIKANHKAKNEH